MDMNLSSIRAKWGVSVKPLSQSLQNPSKSLALGLNQDLNKKHWSKVMLGRKPEADWTDSQAWSCDRKGTTKRIGNPFLANTSRVPPYPMKDSYLYNHLLFRYVWRICWSCLFTLCGETKGKDTKNLYPVAKQHWKIQKIVSSLLVHSPCFLVLLPSTKKLWEEIVCCSFHPKMKHINPKIRVLVQWFLTPVPVKPVPCSSHCVLFIYGWSWIFYLI